MHTLRVNKGLKICVYRYYVRTFFAVVPVVAGQTLTRAGDVVASLGVNAGALRQTASAVHTGLAG